MANKLVNITKAFTLTLVREGEQILLKIEAGVQRLEADIADHWYTKAHSAEVPKGVKQSDAEAAAEAKAAQGKADAEELERMEAEEKAAAEAAAAEQVAAKEAAAKAAAKK
ncbi:MULTISPECIES: hypothetical protein [unclassified Rhodanobacter]|uniref:STY1053 family phage-associated protein n=1 Tax=unclassified Rhodanobacter TaxID=2621553 RepID=UPI001BDDE2BC|nr:MULTISPECIES: hypothetical protein [unclassified Rhodanobacter]MBT2142688.1 hypothetical protein [Rhodanobacter sp. LX-99]MBT2148239.1 hypothetical protein [Rhodanobacter sp. LX-100]